MSETISTMQTAILPWQEKPWQRLMEWHGADRWPHALRLTGSRGVGKTAFAERIADWLLCDRAAANGLSAPCGDCKQCRLRQAGFHPDMQRCRPESSRYIRVDQVRAINEFLSQSPQVARCKVVLIDRADQLNLNAANALLKTLEEPADDTFLVLIQEEGQPLLPTIRSRCQSLALPLPARAVASGWLQTQLDTASEDAGGVARALELSGGAPLLARRYLLEGLLETRAQCLQALRACLKQEIPVNEAAKPFAGAGMELALDFMAHWAHDMARLAEGAQGSDAAAHDMIAFLASRNSPHAAHRLYAAVLEARSHLDNNLNPALEVERLLLLWRQMMPRRRRA